jgi:predicted RNA binding protein YcfA (HicA-like mRNA interferase family)
MPKLRRLSGTEVVKILNGFGFKVVRVRGSHHVLRRTIEIETATGEKTTVTQTVNIPVHANQTLAIGMMQRIFKDVSYYIPEETLRRHFFGD